MPLVSTSECSTSGCDGHTIAPSIRTTANVNNILTAATYLRVESPCGQCMYDLNFTGAALQCSTDISSTYDYSSFVASETQLTLVEGKFDQLGSSVLTVAVRDGSFTSPNGPHQTHGDFACRGTRAHAPYGPMLKWNRGEQNQSVFEGLPMEKTALPDFMQDVSLSLLSGRFLPQNRTYFSAEWGKCWMTQLIYEYSAWRLWSIYGAGWAMSAFCLALGFVYVARNGRERDLEFSKLVKGLEPDHTRGIPKPVA